MRQVKWVVTESQQELRTALRQLGESGPRALEDGRVFVRGRRARCGRERLVCGDWVEIYAPRMQAKEVRILALRGDLAAIDKPAGMSTEPDLAGSGGSLIHAVARQLGVLPERLHAVNRLDVGVSGIVLVAMERKALAAILSARTRGRLVRRYLALSVHTPQPKRGRWNGVLAMPQRGRRDPRDAVTAYALVSEAPREPAPARAPGDPGPTALLAIEPLTGRSHQIRAHTAAAGVPLLGDRLYGGPSALVTANGTVIELDRIALHAARVSVIDASLNWEVVSPVPPELKAHWQQLGGHDQDWSASLELEM